MAPAALASGSLLAGVELEHGAAVILENLGKVALRALTLVQAVEESQGDAGRALSIEDAVTSILRIA